MIVEKAYAKINLALDVVRKRADGYHDLKMIMIPLELHDVMTFEEDKEIVLMTNIEIENNAVIKTAHLIKDRYHVEGGVKITLDKHIPIGAGLGGGSADIAATIRGLNLLWELQLSDLDMEELAKVLGSDTLFCLYNKPAYVYSRGDHLLFIAAPAITSVYLIDPQISVSTKKVFENHVTRHEHGKFNRLFTTYINERYQTFFRKSYNVLTETTKKIYPEIGHVEKKVRKISPLARMSGSGSVYYIPIFKGNERKISKKISKLPSLVIKTDVKH
jgi:4-diphosphocytidyl-2-C-methyl-D-erythritol kinase